MKVIETGIPGLVMIEPTVFTDQRGYFMETFQQERYAEAGIANPFIQDNESQSIRGVIRGLHYQINPFAQAKLVRCVVGSVFDVAVDLRKGSPTFGKWYGLELNEENKRQLFIPAGFAHGFSVLSETAVFTYKCDGVYNKASERSIHPADPKLDIDWQIEPHERIISEKDINAPLFENSDSNFEYTP